MLLQIWIERYDPWAINSIAVNKKSSSMAGWLLLSHLKNYFVIASNRLTEDIFLKLSLLVSDS